MGIYNLSYRLLYLQVNDCGHGCDALIVDGNKLAKLSCYLNLAAVYMNVSKKQMFILAQKYLLA
jgi:hypothetical protein